MVFGEERVITIEYLQPSMSSELLLKFPDSSSFGFDYSQSGIWSPLVPRCRNTSAMSVSCSFMGTRGKLLLTDGCEKISSSSSLQQQEKLCQVKGKPMKKSINSSKNKKNKHKKIKKGLGTPTDGSSPPKLGWVKVLRAAAKNFKKKQRSQSPWKRVLPNP